MSLNHICNDLLTECKMHLRGFEPTPSGHYKVFYLFILDVYWPREGCVMFKCLDGLILWCSHFIYFPSAQIGLYRGIGWAINVAMVV